MKKTLFALLAPVFSLCAADPYAGYFYPSGGAVGQTVTVVVGGQNMNQLRNGIISGDGVTVKSVTQVPGFPYLDGKQKKYVQTWLTGVRSGKPEKPALPEEAETEKWRKHAWYDHLDKMTPLQQGIIARELYTYRNPLQETPSIRRMVLLEIEIAPDAKPGRREIRLWGRGGMTAPRPFFIDDAPHLQEPFFQPPKEEPQSAPQADQLPVVFDGQIMPGETDHCFVRLTAGENYTFAADGRTLQPFIGDAVPGHFQPVLRLLDPAGKEVAFADDNYFLPDPVLYYKAATDGIYKLEIRDNLYRGREDFVYRVKVTPAREEFHALKHFIAADVVADKVGNLHGFDGKANDDIVIDLTGRRAGSPLDGWLRLYDPDGKIIAEADDSPSKLNIGECLQQVDPYLRIKLPKTGEYKVLVRDTTGKFGPDYRYSLRIGPPRPDCELYTASSSLNIPAQGRGNVKLFIRRLDGFDGELLIRGEGVEVVAGALIAKDADEATITIQNPLTLRDAPREVKLIAEFIVNGEKRQRTITPADEYMQAFAYNHLLPAETLYLTALPPTGKRK